MKKISGLHIALILSVPLLVILGIALGCFAHDIKSGREERRTEEEKVEITPTPVLTPKELAEKIGKEHLDQYTSADADPNYRIGEYNIYSFDVEEYSSSKIVFCMSFSVKGYGPYWAAGDGIFVGNNRIEGRGLRIHAEKENETFKVKSAGKCI